ncbi:uncharacterized protein EI97DRAFT_430763 [Westerdykella ornata]|uniref:DNA-binding protein RAP1 n=1 Tax=Westerdykella ornata TaxID=318751 RepID=A0A6A6JU22_WESOR|nr:uncharacterized protein EI97DRAFT_430763 [Westerdykella ornata]KAF2279745.1 hypothetical protein EI97DRAFT_430763 [Westerdykella ornata]
MAAPTVYENVAPGANIKGSLFAGKKFWVSQRIPQRTSFLERIRSNGGEVVLLEKKADYMIADHFRKDCPPGSISYTFIEESIKSGALADPEDHRAGPPLGTAREAGSMVRPTKSSRAPYTTEDDRILYNWVKEYERQGGAVSGNEIYKQLEAKHPRHTWQSYRDRYLKRLQHRKPPTLSVPHNAPPSPPSDQSADQLQSEPQLEPSEHNEMRAPKPKSTPPVKKGGAGNVKQERAKQKKSHTVEELRGMFDEEDWEELYANVDTILQASVEIYLEGWVTWAKGTTQTAEQWQQFFEKVVVPEWKKDATPKKQAIQARVSQRHANARKDHGDEPIVEPSDSTPTPSRKRKTPELELRSASPDAELFDSFVERFLEERQGRRAQSAYMFWAREKGGHRKIAIWEEAPGLTSAELHKRLKPQWDALPDADKMVYAIMEDADRRRVEIEEERARKAARIGKRKVEQEQMPSSSTAVQQTPDYISHTHTRIMQSIESGQLAEFSKQITDGHPSKRRKRDTSPPVKQPKQPVVTGTQRDPLEISSGDQSSESEDDEEMVDALEEQRREEDELEEKDSEEDELPTPSTKRPNDHTPTSDLPPDTPTTPRPPRPHTTAFDTQAILSSPSPTPTLPLQAIPRPQQTQPQPSANRESETPARSSSPLAPSASISTTHSIHEFRRSLQEIRESKEREEEQEPSLPPDDSTLAPLPLPEKTPSSPGSDSDSTDPDPMLRPTEYDRFLAEERGYGFTEDEIKAALHRTGFRPMLASEVLEAWRKGKELPNKRGIWSREDDEAAEGGDGVALALLAKKHSMDGWGGLEERLKFLRKVRDAT